MTGTFGEPIVEGLCYRFDGGLLHEERSGFQLVQVYDNPSLGRVLVLDGLTQTTERDEFTYHEMLVHTPMAAHPDPRRALVIGGGDGGTLRHVLMHPSVERAVMVEIDEAVTNVCRKLMPGIGGDVWDDPRAEVRFEDGIRYVAESEETFDVIIVDSSDPVGPGEGLFTAEFYESAQRRLTHGGLLCVQAGGILIGEGEYLRAIRNATATFPNARLYLGDVLVYPGVRWSYLLCGLDELPTADRFAERTRGIETRYWTPELAVAGFALPAFIQARLAGTPVETWGS